MYMPYIQKLFISPVYQLTLALVTIFYPLAAQEMDKVDSLKSLLSHEQDTFQVHLRQQLSMSYQNYLPDSAMYFGEDALRLSEQLQHNKGKADALLQIGRLQRDNSEYVRALENMLLALDLYQQILDSVQIGNAFNDISIVYALSDDLITSKEYFLKALDVFKKTGDVQGESYALNNIGNIYEILGDLDKAEEFYKASLKMKRSQNDIFGISRAYYTLGNLSKKRNQFDKALAYFFQADSLFMTRKDELARANNLQSIAETFLSLNDPVQARDYAQQSYSIAVQLDNMKSKIHVLKTLSDVCAAQGDYEAAYQYQLMHQTFSDSLNAEKNEKQLAEIKAGFDDRQQKTEIDLLKHEKMLQEASIVQQKTISFSLLIGLFITFGFSVALFQANRRNKQKNVLLATKNDEIQQKTEALSRQKKDLTQLNQTKDKLFSIISHDIRSPLNTLKSFSFLLSQERKIMKTEEVQLLGGQINRALDNLSQLLDNLLNWSLMQTGSTQPEFRAVNINELINTNISLYADTAANKQIQLVQDSCEKIFAWADYQSVNTMIRNILSNSIKFSYPNSSIKLSAHQTENEVAISIADQGVGMSEEVLKDLFVLDKKHSMKGTCNEIGSGFGLTLCQELVSKNNGRILVSSKLKEGSTFTIVLPVKVQKEVKAL